MITITVGTLTLAASLDVARGQEYAAYREVVRVEPGTYELRARVAGEGHVSHLYAMARGTCTEAWYGSPGDRRIGTQVEITISVNPYWLGEAGDAPAGVEIDAASGLVIESWSPRPGERMSHYTRPRR